MQGIDMQFEAYEDMLQDRSVAAYDAAESALKAAMESVEPFHKQESELGNVTPYSKVTIMERAKIQTAAYDLAAALTDVRLKNFYQPDTISCARNRTTLHSITCPQCVHCSNPIFHAANCAHLSSMTSRTYVRNIHTVV